MSLNLIISVFTTVMMIGDELEFSFIVCLVLDWILFNFNLNSFSSYL